MSAINSPPDSSLFTISPDQKAKYEVQFKKICPTGDFVSGTQARELFLKSGLPPKILAHIWNLADVDCDGKMDINEFSIALHLIALKLKGVELPPTLPQSLKLLVEPPPFAAFNNDPTPPTTMINNSQTMSKSSSQILSSSNSIKPRMGSVGDISSGIKKPPTATSTPISSAEWAIPQQTKLKYTQIFNQNDRQRTGFLTGIQARSILLESKLPQTTLAQIWNLSDVDVDGRLTCEEFVLAMHLVDKAKRGEPLPAKLSPDLIPPSYRRGSGTLSHTSSLDDSSEHNDLSNISKSSFEDKRRENYEKGQAELDRRRAALQELERRTREERERKEREENARKEKERLEAERRRQEEIEMQRQKLRQQELEREEQKRRQQEVRELARKEMERQRQRELEKAKRSELLLQRSKLLEEIHKLKTRKKVLAIEHEQMDKNLVESKKTAQASRDKVVRIKSEIDGMRIKRDELLSKQSQIKTQMKSLTEKQLFVEQEKVRLAAQLKSLIANTSNGVNPDQQLTTFASILQAKQSQINQLRSQLELTEQEFKTKKEDVINSKQELEKLKRTFQEKRREAMKFAELLEAKRVEAEKVRDGKAQSKFASETDVAWGQEVPTDFAWPSTTHPAVTKADSIPAAAVADNNTTASAVRTKFRYRCVFEFEARNEDEITIKPGDIIMVDTSACSEEGWLSGEINGKIGWFPKDYAVLDEDEQTGADANQAISEPVASATAVVQEAKALYDWAAQEENHLSFSKDDLIRITQKQDSWCFGELLDSNGQVKSSGWFPESYVQILSTGTDSTSTPMVNNQAASVGGDQSQYYISLYAFETVEPGDLGFDVNELIKVEKQEGDWWTGVIIDRTTGQEIPNRRGIFPSNFVGPADPSDIPKTSAQVTSSSNTASATNPSTATAVTTTKSPSMSKKHQSLDRKESDITDSPKPSKKGKSKKQEIVQAVAAYTATGPEQLSLEVGQLIAVRKKTTTGWWEGELQAKGKKKQVGWFPASYVKPLGGGGGPAPATASTTTTTTTTVIAPADKSAADEPEIERVQALYPFNAQREDEISFEKDDIIRVLSKTDPTWWRGHNTRTGAVGLFPSNHVQSLSTSDGGTTNNTAADSSVTSYLYDDQTTPVDYYQKIDSDSLEINAGNGYNEDYDFDEDSFSDVSDDDYNNDVDMDEINMNDSLVSSSSPLPSFDSIDEFNKNINHRKNLFQELVSTEHDYIKDLYFIIDNYIDRIQQSNLISQEDCDLFFKHFEKIYDVNRSFFNDLNQRFQDSKNPNNLRFCDLLLHHLQKMLPIYQEFFSKQITALNRLQDRIETNQAFDELLKQILKETKSPLPLSSYMIKPMQRITKYPLLIEKIHKCTPSDHPDYHDCSEALKFAKQFCSNMNDACKKTENFDKLHWMQRSIVIPIKCIPHKIVFNSETRFLGPRTLIRAGILIKVSSSKTLAAFLFNDFLLLATPNRKGLKLYNIKNFFHSKPALSCTYTMYRKPMMLNDIRITNISEFEHQIDPGIFRLFIESEKRAITLRAHSSIDCTQWLNEIQISRQNYMDSLKKLMKTNLDPVMGLNCKPIGHVFVTIVEAINIYSHKPYIEVQCQIAIGDDWQRISTKIFRTPAVSSSPKRNNFYQSSSSSSSFRSKSISSLNRISPDSAFISSLSNNNNFVQDHHHHQIPLKIIWNSDTKFLITNLNSNLLIRCFDVNPFEPDRLIGETAIPLKQILEDSQSIGGPMIKNIQLKKSKKLNNDNHPEPCLLIKYKMILNTN